MIDSNNLNDLIGADVYGSDDNKIGSVGQVYVDEQAQTPTWVTIKTGLFGTSETFAPLQDATFDGHDVRVAYTKDKVKDAPRID
ncbi:MAG: photosystem reaction center subunit H, partial [Gordonia sp. (in: high G+C Gram-positive bacteria)]